MTEDEALRESRARSCGVCRPLRRALRRRLGVFYLTFKNYYVLIGERQ
jgi:hypothetical protein